MNRDQLEAALTGAVRSAQAAVDRTDELAAQLLGINRTDLRCLDVLQRAAAPLSAGDLAEELLVTTGAITALIDRLERAGYIRRVTDPNDRRRVLVELQPEATTKALQIYAPLAEAGQKILENLSKAELGVVIGFLREDADLNRRFAETLRAQLDGADDIARLTKSMKDASREIKVQAKELKATVKHEFKRRARPQKNA